jgi:hypothetical protein
MEGQCALTFHVLQTFEREYGPFFRACKQKNAYRAESKVGKISKWMRAYGMHMLSRALMRD